MLKVTIELLPGGFAPMRRTIASMRISNASDLADISDYVVEAVEGANPLTGTPAVPPRPPPIRLAPSRQGGV